MGLMNLSVENIHTCVFILGVFNSERDHYQDRFMKTPERQLPSAPGVACQ